MMRGGYGGGGQAPAQIENPAISAAVLEMKSMTEMFAKMSAACFKKCVVTVHEADLNVGEMSCVDRCVGKYLTAQEKVGLMLQEENEKAAAAMQQQPQ